MDLSSRPIGVFDSGVGGLTVLRALRERLSDERFLYLGDTARVPYGTKSADTVRAYAMNAGALLIDRGVKCIVVACNSASAVAIPAMRERWADTPIIGVIEPGARAIGERVPTGTVLVLATESTVASGAYQRSIEASAPGVRVVPLAATLLVALVEEGWTDGPLVESIVQRIIEPVRFEHLEAVLLGCTHFPALTGAIGSVLGDEVSIVDSARTTAEAVRAELLRRGLLSEIGPGDAEYLATDGPERFARISERFLDRPISAADVECVDLV